MIDTLKQEKIALEVIKVLKSRFDSFPDDLAQSRNAPFHQAFLGAFADKLTGKVLSIPFFISLSSWAHGLSTTLGQNFFENVAHILCDGAKKEFTTRRTATLKLSPSQKRAVSTIVTELSNGVRQPNVDAENELIFVGDDVETIAATDFTADVFYQDAGQIVCLELKTVKPNKGVFKYEKDKMLEAKAALRNKYPNKEIRYYLGFPFDPLSVTPTGYDKVRFARYSVDFRKYIAPDEFLLAAELWDFLAGSERTMEMILEIINAIAMVNFLDDFEFINEVENLKIDSVAYLDLLSKWRLEREHSLAKRAAALEANMRGNATATRIYNQPLFTEAGKYNEDRCVRLQAL
ncbi:MAG: TdeIII family type II restriction endonuclease [Pyrinomonadaceae bacterium MAG19_C2-C3]|nr:TdeIII family type II restriction endonuclease [Pyrinomonadaceae bacterium MAG19_C2-C3]